MGIEEVRGESEEKELERVAFELVFRTSYYCIT